MSSGRHGRVSTAAHAAIPDYVALHAPCPVLVVPYAGAFDPAAALLGRVNDSQADLLVMGCYGHSRFRETLLGGVSRTVLRSMTVPTLLAH